MVKSATWIQRGKSETLKVSMNAGKTGKVTVKGDGWAVVTAEAAENPEDFTDTCLVYCVPKN